LLLGAEVNTVAEAILSFNRWSKDTLPVENSLMAMDVLLGVYLAERKGRQPATFKDLCWDLRCSEEAIRTTVDRLAKAQWVTLEQDKRFRLPISRLRIPPDKAAVLEDGLKQLLVSLGSGS
jgi:hypothetical protein